LCYDLSKHEIRKVNAKCGACIDYYTPVFETDEQISMEFRIGGFRVSERVFGISFGHKWEEEARGWRKVYGVEFMGCLYFYYQDVEMRRKLSGHVTRVESMRNACRNLVGKPVKKTQIGKTRSRLENNI
jgi:hypothetical protein